jgi:Fe-S cluster assembly ATPase SufC
LRIRVSGHIIFRKTGIQPSALWKQDHLGRVLVFLAQTPEPVTGVEVEMFLSARMIQM